VVTSPCIMPKVGHLVCKAAPIRLCHDIRNLRKQCFSLSTPNILRSGYTIFLSTSSTPEIPKKVNAIKWIKYVSSKTENRMVGIQTTTTAAITAATAAMIEPAMRLAPLGFVFGVTEGRGVPRVLLEPKSVVLPLPMEPVPLGLRVVLVVPAASVAADPEALDVGISTIWKYSQSRGY
jgi:hypothetical protein